MEEQQTSAISKAKKRVKLRAILAVVAVLVSAWAVNGVWDRLMYFFQGGELVDVGDVRELRAKGVKELPVKPGSYVRLRNLMVIRDEVSTKKYRFFYCPIYKVVVRTARPLPEGSIRVADAEIPEGLEYLVEQRKVFPDDFSRSFDAEGWLLPLRKIPGWERGINKWVYNEIKLTDEEVDAAYALLDGEKPNNQYWAMFVLICGILIVVSSAWGLLVSVRALGRLTAMSSGGD